MSKMRYSRRALLKGGAAALAALMQESELNAGQRVAVVLSGANIDRAALAELLRFPPGARAVASLRCSR